MTNTTSSSISTTKTAIYFTFDHFNKKIVGTEQNFKKSGISGTAQYNALMAAMKAHPNYELSAMAPKVKKQTYKGLNFELMMDYVEFKGNEIQKAEFEEIVSSNATYPTIKSWFLDNFKVGFTVEKATREIAQHKLGERKDKVRAAVRVKPVKAAPAVVNF
jgi:hypothetical protein